MTAPLIVQIDRIEMGRMAGISRSPGPPPALKGR
jgi:hypothetical protein